MSDTKIPLNVFEFLDRASSDVGRLEEQSFNHEMFNQINDVGISSPIEQLFFIALHAVARANLCDVDAEAYMDHAGNHCIGAGVHTQPQFKIGTYRVDFLIQHLGYGAMAWAEREEVVVELDGHDFHDKDKRQRSYEKARERHIVKAGYKILRYTGSDVVADPYKVAYEVLETVGALGAPCGFAPPYDAANPLGLD